MKEYFLIGLIIVAAFISGCERDEEKSHFNEDTLPIFSQANGIYADAFNLKLSCEGAGPNIFTIRRTVVIRKPVKPGSNTNVEFQLQTDPGMPMGIRLWR